MDLFESKLDTLLKSKTVETNEILEIKDYTLGDVILIIFVS